jgi:multidrug efflux pump subunit AcrB
VVIENVQRHMHMEHSKPREATSRAMGEVTSAVIATSLVLIAVFVPVSFFPGTTGILYRQFSLTIAFSIAISAFNALTLSPALSALFLRGEEARPRQLDFLHIDFVSRAFAAFIHGADDFITWLGNTYARHSRGVATALPAAGGVPGRTGRDRLCLSRSADGIHSSGRPGLFHGDCAGAAGLLADLHHGAG